MDNIVKKSTDNFLNLFFNENEEICVSDCSGGYHSVKQELDNITLISPTEGKGSRNIGEKDINLVAINPIKGWRRDKNVTSFRSFLIEMDDESIVEQKKYIENIGMPYSVCIFSGNKSLHFGIVLDEDLFNRSVWKLINRWILNIVEKADQQCNNPSRSIRFPNNQRKNGKKLKQSLVDIKKRVSHEELFEWLNNFPDKKPKKKREVKKVSSFNFSMSITGLSSWCRRLLEDGVDSERNKTWFRIGCNCHDKGFLIDNAIDMLEPYFNEEGDFRRDEWIGCIKSAYGREG